MKPEEFEALRKEAAVLFDSQPAKGPKISLDAIFVGLVNTRTISVRKARPRAKDGEEAVPKWFNDTVTKFRKSGEDFTIGRFLMVAGQFPATRDMSFKVARWLRDAKVVERKTGGNLIFGPIKKV